MFPSLESRYPLALLDERARIAAQGSFRDRVRYDLIPRPHYAFGLLAAADAARFAGVTRITAIEFGVAEGAGLLNLCALAPQVSAETGVEIDIAGFDTGIGLPALEDYRDHPEIWKAGDFATGSKEALLAQLPPQARMVWGDVAETLPEFIATLSPQAPVGFVSVDVDIYRSTRDCLRLFTAPVESLLPVMIAYFDDTIGGLDRIGALMRNRYAGQLLAIDEFNAEQQYRKIDRIPILTHRRPLDREPWLDQIYGVHALDHPLRSAGGGNRRTLSVDAHGGSARMAWPL